MSFFEDSPYTPPIKVVRKITPEKIERLKDKLNSLSWDEVLVANDVNTSYDKFMCQTLLIYMLMTTQNISF